MGDMASDSMKRRVYRAACCVESGDGAAPGSGSGSGKAATSGVSRHQLVVFLADVLRGTAEERAPLVLAMSQQEGAGHSEAVAREQVSQVKPKNMYAAAYRCSVQVTRVAQYTDPSLGRPTDGKQALYRLFIISHKSCLILLLYLILCVMVLTSPPPFLLYLQFLQDVLSAVVQILAHRGRLQGWRLDRMGDVSVGIKLLAEQMCSELKASGTREGFYFLLLFSPCCPPALFSYSTHGRPVHLLASRGPKLTFGPCRPSLRGPQSREPVMWAAWRTGSSACPRWRRTWSCW